MSFTLDPRLAADTIKLDESEHCLLLLMNDSQYPWLILVPKVEKAEEWHDLPEPLQLALHQFCVKLGQSIKQSLNAHKINTAALGNVVRQLHIHVIARFKEDPAWPGPVWGKTPALAYTEQHKTRLIGQLTWPELP